MLRNKDVKNYLNKFMEGTNLFEAATIPGYPTIDIRTATVATKTADYTVTVADLATPTIFDNAGDAGVQVLTLPAVALAKGKVIRAHVLAAQVIRLLPATGEAINYNGSAVVTKYLNVAGVIGNHVEVFCDGTQWVVTQGNGVVTKEA